ncbi:hypothetical protein [Parabacteroides distasonis]|uniref:DUF4906 domain-containing protein n=1 Tax=Parabacteroides distasonis TaxID=823 RepID=UPI002330099B|nr:hypothetical protein [Parabacteroides distasonis]MDB9080803.1 hypothetical protein [Parabacteroides distasonis]
MKINIVCLLCLLFSACNNENIIEPSSGNGDECAFQFMLKAPGTIEVDTKGIDTKAKAILKLGETAVYNVWILQFKSDGTELLKAVFANQDDIQSVGGDDTYDQLLIQLTKEGMRFKNEDSVFYIIVNGEASTATEETANLFVAAGGIPATLTEGDLMAKTKDITYSADGSATGANILSSGPTAYKKDGTNTDMKLVVLSRMYRAFAKVTVHVESSIKAVDGQFSLIPTTPVIIANVPKKTRLYDDGSSPYPASGTTNFYDETPVSGITLGEKYGTFYLAENIRGTGTATSAQEKNIGSKGPGGTLNDCTYLLVKGQYKYYLGQISGASKYSDPIDVEYKFYLGGDLVTDYNIYRDYHYKITVDIAGPNSADYRVKITNGNVAVFDDADTVENEVTF